jgi:uncharacterized protein involved in type VI secretion and phage assembly
MENPELQRHYGKYYGKYSAIVTDTNDLERKTNGMVGRIKVQIPSIFPEKDEVWADPCFPPGCFFIPPKDSYVWVEFEGGDIRSPLWVGVWYPKDKVPQGVNPAFSDKSIVFQTPAGSTIEIQEQSGSESIKITEATGKIKIVVSALGEVTLKISGLIKLEAKAPIEISALGGISLQDDAHIALGKEAQDHVMLFEKFAQWWDTQVKPVWSSHIHPTSMGPSGPTTMSLPSPNQFLTASIITKAK